MDELTQREKEIVDLVKDGLSNDEIALKLMLTVQTVKNNLNSVYNKLSILGLNKRVQLIQKARNINLPQIQNILPTFPTTFIGRETEIEDIKKLLKTNNRLITLTGPGGNGKTRLVVELINQIKSYFKDGICYVALASLKNTNKLKSAIANAFGIDDTSNLDDTLRNFFYDKELLLVLDNFEQLVTAAPDIRDIIEKSKYLKILITSREPIGILLEHEYPVPTLDYPQSILQNEEIKKYSAIALFLDRAKLTNPKLEITHNDSDKIVQICVRLAGIPLAIELAAARLDVLSIETLAKQLKNCLDILADSRKDIPSRQKTIFDTIKWSFDPLTAHEQYLFICSSLFIGGFTYEAIKYIYKNNDLNDNLSSLINKNLIQKPENSRFYMLEPIREFGFSLVQQRSEFDLLMTKYTNYYLFLVKECSWELNGAKKDEYIQKFTVEQDNMRILYGYMIFIGEEVELLAKLTLYQWYYWLLSGRINEGRNILDMVLSRMYNNDTHLHAELLYGAAKLALADNDIEQALKHIDESLLIFQKLEDQTNTIKCSTLKLEVQNVID